MISKNCHIFQYYESNISDQNINLHSLEWIIVNFFLHSRVLLLNLFNTISFILKLKRIHFIYDTIIPWTSNIMSEKILPSQVSWSTLIYCSIHPSYHSNLEFIFHIVLVSNFHNFFFVDSYMLTFHKFNWIIKFLNSMILRKKFFPRKINATSTSIAWYEDYITYCDNIFFSNFRCVLFQ